MVSAIIAGVASLAAAGISAAQAAKKRRQAQAVLEGQNRDNKSWYSAHALGDYTQRSDVQRLMAQLRDNLRERSRADASTAAVTGATAESVAASKDSANRAIGNTYGNISAMGQRYKDRITDQYQQMKNNYAGAAAGNASQDAASYENLMRSGLNLAASSASSITQQSAGKSNYSANNDGFEKLPNRTKDASKTTN